jgi:hypothetical protein
MARAGQSGQGHRARTVGTEKAGSGTRQSGPDCRDRPTGLDSSAGIGQAGQVSPDRISWTAKLGQASWDRSV